MIAYLQSLRGFAEPEAIYPAKKEETIGKTIFCLYYDELLETSIYTGVSSNLIKRVYEHKNKLIDGFTKKYNINKLVYYEVFDNIETAIMREKQIKAGSRKKKVELIKNFNPNWIDLYESIIG